MRRRSAASVVLWAMAVYTGAIGLLFSTYHAGWSAVAATGLIDTTFVLLLALYFPKASPHPSDRA